MDEIKYQFERARLLTIMRDHRDCGIQTYASKIGVGARLLQFDKDEEYSVAYASRTLRDAETRYTATEQELLAVVWALKKWKAFLYGQNIVVRTDHKALTFATGYLLIDDQMTRWVIMLQQYNVGTYPRDTQ